MDEVKKSLDFMSAELTRPASQQDLLIGLVEEVKQLKFAINNRDKRIAKLEQKIDDLEKYTRLDDLLITGLETRH